MPQVITRQTVMTPSGRSGAMIGIAYAARNTSDATVNGQSVNASHRLTVIRPVSRRADPAVLTLAIIVAV